MSKIFSYFFLLSSSLFFLVACSMLPTTTSETSDQEKAYINVPQYDKPDTAEITVLGADEESKLDILPVTEPKEEKVSIELRIKKDELPLGIQTLSGELDPNSTTQYHIASAQELQRGRKTGDDISAFIQLDLQPTVYFDFNQSTLGEESKQVLDTYIVAFTKHNINTPTITVKLMLEGHTDHVGTTQYNLSLGFRRALSVKAFLKNRGISANALETESYGEERPVFEQAEEQYQRYNRRVEIYFDKK